MAATVTYPDSQEAYQSIGSLRATYVRVTLATNDYLTGGVDVTSKLASGKVIGALVLNTTGTGALTQIPAFNATTKKLVLLKGTAGVNAEVANASSDSQVIDLLVLTV